MKEIIGFFFLVARGQNGYPKQLQTVHGAGAAAAYSQIAVIL